MTITGPSASNTLWRHGASTDRTKLLLDSWIEKASKKKGLLSTVSILPLAACGGGNTPSTVSVTTLTADSSNAVVGGTGADMLDVQGFNFTGNVSGVETITMANGASIAGSNSGAATGATTAVITGAVSMTAAQHNGFATVNAAGTTDEIVLSGSGDVIADADIETYYLGDDGRAITMSADSSQSVIGGIGADTLAVQGATFAGTVTAVETITMTAGADITGANSGAVTGATTVDITGAVSMTAAQHNGFATVNAAGTADQITLADAGALTGAAAVESYVLAAAGGSAITLGDAAQNVSTGSNGGDTVDFAGFTATGAINTVAADTLVLDDGANVVAVEADGVVGGAFDANNMTISDSVTMTVEQHNSVSISAAGGDDKITLSNIGTLAGDGDVEGYVIMAASDFTLGALGQDVTETQTGAQNAVSTLTFGSGAYSGTFVGFGALDQLKVVNGTDISGATGLTNGEIDFADGTATVTLNAAQNGSLTIRADGADSGVQTIVVDVRDEFTGDANVENYSTTAGSTFTLGSLSQNATEIGTEANSTVVFSAGAYTGNLTDFDAADTLRVVDGTDLSGNSVAHGILDFNSADAAVTLTVAQHGAMTIGNAVGQQTISLSDAGSVTAKAGIEQYNLSDSGSTTFTQSASTSALTVVAGSRDDLIVTNGIDANRDGLSVNLSSGGNDTVRLLNDTGAVDVDGLVTSDFGGFGGTRTGATAGDRYNDSNIVNTQADWVAEGSQGASTYADIVGFMASATHNDRDMIQLSNFTGGVVEDVNRTTTDLTGIASGSVLEINTASYTVAGDQFGALNSVATMLDSLSNVADGEYYIVAYNGSDANADAALYYARATEGDGFDFADTNGSTGGYDTDSLELLAVFHEVGANELSSLNFEAVV